MKPRIPRGEESKVRYLDRKGELRFILTLKTAASGNSFILYSVSENGELVKLGKGKNPIILEEKFEVDEHLDEGAVHKRKHK